MNLLLCSAGRRCELIKNFKDSMGKDVTIVATDNSYYAPALYLADRKYLVPLINDQSYIPTIIDICKKEHIDAITTLIDPEIEILSKNRDKFEAIGVEVLAPYEKTASYCFNKYEMFNFLKKNLIPTVDTYGCLKDFEEALSMKKIAFPVFVKPRTGSGSVGAQRVDDEKQLKTLLANDSSLIIQELMTGVDVDADVYVDTISHKAVSAFSKKKIETKIGGASKTVSFKDDKLFEFIKEIVSKFEFNGPIDMDFFFKDGQYYLSEINPRFGGAYLHAYGAGVDFVKLIEQNVKGLENVARFGDYEEGVVMMMYDSVVICRQNELLGNSNDIGFK